MLSKRSSSSISMRSRSVPGSAGAWWRARHAALAALALLPAACSDFAPGDGELDDASALLDAAEADLGEAAEALSLPFPIEPLKSLTVTEVDIVSQFSLKDVLQQLVTQSGVPGLTPLTLFQRFMDTYRAAPGLYPSVPHCDSVAANPNDVFPPPQPGDTPSPGSINGWPVRCPRTIGQDSGIDPFSTTAGDNAYMATTLANRFDLAPPDGAHCGEYRIVFARKSGHPDFSNARPDQTFRRSFIIFEGRLPNPSPSLGRQGCRPIVDFWLNQSSPSKSVATRAAELKSFYFNGLPASGVGPVIHIDNYGHTPGPNNGQIRTNEFLLFQEAFDAWPLREFRLTHGTSSSPSLNVIPSFVKDNPAAKLFAPGISGDSRVTSFQSTVFPNLVERLAAADDVNRFAYPSALPDAMNAGESLMIPLQNNYLNAIGSGTSTLRTNIANKLIAMGSDLSGTPTNLSVDQIVGRAQSLACAGCHEPVDATNSPSSSLDVGLSSAFPKTLVFTHTSEKTAPVDENDPNGPRRFILSEAVLKTFLPYREKVMTHFLLNNATLGFEKPGAWTSTQALLATHTGRVKEGIASLEVRTPSSFNAIVSPNFSTSGLTPVGNKIKLSLFVSKQQPNPSWVGNLEVLISIPSAGINNQWAGNVVLNGLTRGVFNEVTFSQQLPAATVAALNAAPSDVKLQFNFNVTANSGPYYMDDIRFEN
ncbi:hypothetical protein BE21_49760 [Sorangium cellulosum]|uniref:Uncharacterized protein n=1 Tax=Sorangium cellulosum TaxID=56 RepID=A0A150TGN0_SORCE|nr:hypothetical protein BE21_49760 [Sorangium cellulosum]